MSIVDEFLAAEAAGRFRAVRRRGRRHLHDGGDVRICVPFHHAGNDFSVVGLAFGRPRRRPDVLVCPPDPLDRIDVVARLTPFVDAFLGWVDTHPVAERVNANTGRPYFAAARCPQLLVPSEGSRTAIDNMAYFLRHVPDDWADAARLQRLGWELSALVEASEWPGQSGLVPLTKGLSEHWALGLSGTETESLAAAVALVNAGPTGLVWDQFRAAENIAVGPLGDPETFDDVAYRNARRGSHRPAPQVVAAVEAAWSVTVEAWAALAALPESVSAGPAHLACVSDWAGRVGPGRHRGRWGRRAVPPLGRSAQRLGDLEDAQTALIAAQAAADPLVAAQLAADGSAVLADHVRTSVDQVGQSATVYIEIDTAQLRVPGEGTPLLVCHTLKPVIGVVTSVQGGPGAWQMIVTVRTRLGRSTGVNTAKQLNPDHVRWLVPPPPQYRPKLQLPRVSPLSHPGAVVVWNPNGPDPTAPDIVDVLDDGGPASGDVNA